MAVLDQKDSLLAVACARLVIAGILHFARCVPCCRSQALMPASWPVWTRGTVVIDVGCAGPANSSGSVVEETAELPQLQLVELWTGRCMPVVCNDRRRGRCPRAVHRRWWTSLWCRSDKFQLRVLASQMHGLEETVVLPQFLLVDKIVTIPEGRTPLFTCPVVCNDRCRGAQSAEN